MVGNSSYVRSQEEPNSQTEGRRWAPGAGGGASRAPLCTQVQFLSGTVRKFWRWLVGRLSDSVNVTNVTESDT